MGHGNAQYVAFGTAAQAALRMLIASYFIAVALGLIPGTDLGILFSGVLVSPHDGATAAGIVFVLSFMIMIGMATRAAALILALLTFYASYLSMIALGVDQELGSFWRDLALIGALLLTYSEPAAGSRTRRRLVHRSIVPRRITSHPDAAFGVPRMARPAPAVGFGALRQGADHVEVDPILVDVPKSGLFDDVDRIVDSIWHKDESNA
jgi:uncharacterized membrane protein YphA (DoxX/SURF4 family)